MTITRTAEETAIIKQTLAGQAVLPNSTMDTRKTVDVTSEIDGCRYVCRIYNWTENAMHYVFEMDVAIDASVPAAFSHRKRIYLLDNGEYCMAYVGDDLATVFNVIVNEAKEDHAFLELYTDNHDVEAEFKEWAEGRENKDEAEGEECHYEEDRNDPTWY